MEHIWPIPHIHYGALKDIQEDRSVTVLHTQAAYDAIKAQLPFSPAQDINVTEATLDYWDGLMGQIDGDVIYAIGGGLPVDAGKYISLKMNRPLVSIPTAISVDAFLTWASGYRKDGCVYYDETKIPDQLIVDFDMIGAGPDFIRAAGITDVLSIATGSTDWAYAHKLGKNPDHTPYDAHVEATAQSILDAVIDCAESAGKGERAGLARLLECLAMEVQLCNFIGHSRPEEGSEHYFAYAVENTMGKGLPHGDLVGPGILLMAQLHGLDVPRLQQAMEYCGIPLNNIPEEVILETLRSLPEYCIQHNLPHGIAHDLDEDKINSLQLRF